MARKQSTSDQRVTMNEDLSFPWKTATAVPWSSIVGGGCLLHDATGKVIGQVIVLNGGERAKELQDTINRMIIGNTTLLEKILSM